MLELKKEVKTSRVCLLCGDSIALPKRLFCCPEHKNNYYHKISGYKYHKKYRSASPKNYLSHLRSYYKRSSTLSIDFLVTLFNDQKGRCAISGEIMTHLQGEGKVETNISIDKIDATLGYTENNIQLVCHRVNIMKQEYSTNNLMLWCKRIINNGMD